ncbi:MAG TPA: hypothetical protein VG226_11325 [Acidimicrobiales bacterium]|nr:hypothetical protein [Acidimicrobiales bacterium]
MALEWVGGSFDPAQFDLASTNAAPADPLTDVFSLLRLARVRA